MVTAEAVQELPGRGLEGLVKDASGTLRKLRLGSPQYTDAELSGDSVQQQVVLAEERADGWHTLAHFDLHEDVRPEAAAVVRQLQQDGVQVLLLSGDRSLAVQRVAQQVGIVEAHGGCTPGDKLARMQAAQAQGRHVAMVGDGLNDGPVLAGAHVSFAFGRAVPLAQARSDFVVLGDQLALVPQTLLLARRTLRIVRQNLWWAACYNALSVPLAVVGWMPAWLAGLGMAASSLLVVLNAARLSRRLPEINVSPVGGASAAPAQPVWEMA